MRSLALGALLALLGCSAAPAPVRPAGPTIVPALDAAIADAWRQRQIAPAALIDDATYLRRVTIDVAGRLPTEDEVRSFGADASADKRARLVDRLLRSGDYAEHWADYWDAVLMGRTFRSQDVDRAVFRNWLRDHFARNTPWSRLVYELLTASGYNTAQRPIRNGAQQMPGDWPQRVNGAVNWHLRYRESLPDLAGTVSRVFLGVQIQCAQCHDHKSEPFKRRDFQSFTAAFTRSFPRLLDRGYVVGLRRLEWRDWPVTPPARFARFFPFYGDYGSHEPRLLAGPAFVGARPLGRFENPRQAVAGWLTAREQRQFARALVNRMWGHFLGRGFVEPVDDFRTATRPDAPAALERLTEDFVSSGHDLARLIRVITATRAYQLGNAPPGATARPALFSAFPLKPLPVEVTLRVLGQVTHLDAFLRLVAGGGRGAGPARPASPASSDMLRRQLVRRFVTVQGTDDRLESVEFEGTIPAALLFLNGPLVNGAVRHGRGLFLAEATAAEPDDARLIERLFLRTLSRSPTATELAELRRNVAEPRAVVRTPRPPLMGSDGGPSFAELESRADVDFAVLAARARTGRDFRALFQRAKNDADLKLIIDAVEDLRGAVSFRLLDWHDGGRTARQQAFEDLFWALVNSTEFLTNH